MVVIIYDQMDSPLLISILPATIWMPFRNSKFIGIFGIPKFSHKDVERSSDGCKAFFLYMHGSTVSTYLHAAEAQFSYGDSILRHNPRSLKNISFGP